MAKIFSTKEQKSALKYINNGIKELSQIRSFINYSKESYGLVITGKGMDKQYKVQYGIDQNMAYSILTNYYKQKVKEIKKKAIEFHIELDNEDTDLINTNSMCE